MNKQLYKTDDIKKAERIVQLVNSLHNKTILKNHAPKTNNFEDVTILLLKKKKENFKGSIQDC